MQEDDKQPLIQTTDTATTVGTTITNDEYVFDIGRGGSINHATTGAAVPVTWGDRFFQLTKNKAVRVIFFGQIISLLNCGTAISSTALVTDHNVNIPTAQSFLNYLLLACVYGGIMIHRGAFLEVLRCRGMRYFFIAIADVEANYTIVKAYQYTTMTSIQLLDCLTIIVVVGLSWWLLSTKYSRWHVAGVAVCFAGLCAVVFADIESKRNNDKAPKKWLGDLLCAIAATLYGISNVAQEHSVKSFDFCEFLCFLGFWGVLINGIQLAALERHELAEVTWNSSVVGLLLIFSFCLFALYSTVPLLMKWSSATFLNLSLLTSDVYSLLFGLFLFHYNFSWLYFLSFSLVILGVSMYFTAKDPAEARDGCDTEELAIVQEA